MPIREWNFDCCRAGYNSIWQAQVQRPPSPKPHQRGESRTFNGDRRQGRPRSTQNATTEEETVVKSVIQRPQPQPTHTMVTRFRARASGDPPDTTWMYLHSGFFFLIFSLDLFISLPSLSPFPHPSLSFGSIVHLMKIRDTDRKFVLFFLLFSLLHAN